MTCFRPAYLLLYWIETLHTATYNLNRQPTKTLGTSTLFFALYSTHQHILISVCLIVRVTKTCHLQPHINYHPIFLCVFLGYSTDHEGYKCLDLQSNRIINLHHVVFDEFSFPFAKVSTTSVSFMLGLLLQHLAIYSYLQDQQEASAHRHPLAQDLRCILLLHRLLLVQATRYMAQLHRLPQPNLLPLPHRLLPAGLARPSWERHHPFLLSLVCTFPEGLAVVRPQHILLLSPL
jgi:hypothetical protein